MSTSDSSVPTVTPVESVADAAVDAAARRVRRRSAGGSGGSIPEVAFANACRFAQENLRRRYPRRDTNARLRRTPACKKALRAHAASYTKTVAQWLTVLTDGCHVTAQAHHADIAHLLASSAGSSVDPLDFYGGDRGALGAACAVPVAAASSDSAVAVAPIVAVAVKNFGDSDSDEE